VRRELAGGFELDDDPRRVDVDAVHAFLSEHAYWARGRPLETIERLVHDASRVVGLYQDGRQVGFCRAFTDGISIAYLADVYVLPGLRGRGLGEALVRQMVEEAPFDVKWILHTEDAHPLYRKLGFAEPSYKVMERASRPDTPG
jgi:GNAT superfamily N-acetyltransferase